MHAEMRRVPAERARHAKRLGHVQGGSGHALLADAGIGNGTTTTQQGQGSTIASSQSSSIPATLATYSSSSAPTSSTISSSSSLSSVTTSSNPTIASSTGTQHLTGPASSSSLVLSAGLTSVIQASSTSAPQTNVAVTNSGLSGGAIAGIIAGAAIVGAALIVFLVRKTYLRRRERKHISWNGAPGLGAGISDELKPFPDISERRASLSSTSNSPQRTVLPSPFPAHGQPMYSTPTLPHTHVQPSIIPAYSLPTPPATYNNPTAVTTYPTHHIPLPYSPGNPATHGRARIAAGTGASSTLSARAQHAPMEATVKCTFVPTLPDELSITTGERVFVVEQYDDGWDLCTNARGERGMVPRECLEHGPVDQTNISWRDVRTSSLNSDGRRLY